MCGNLLKRVARQKLLDTTQKIATPTILYGYVEDFHHFLFPINGDVSHYGLILSISVYHIKPDEIRSDGWVG